MDEQRGYESVGYKLVLLEYNDVVKLTDSLDARRYYSLANRFVEVKFGFAGLNLWVNYFGYNNSYL